VQAAPAVAVPRCPGASAPRTLLSGQPTLESVIVGEDGRLYYTDTGKKAVMVLDRPGATPRVLAADIESPGGMVFEPAGRLVVGYGDGFVTGALGNLVGMAGLVSLDTTTGRRRTLATGLTMANGVARGADAALYASADVGLGIDRIAGGRVQRNWTRIVSSNGLVVDSTGRYLFAAQTFVPAAIRRIEIRNPTRSITWFHAKPLDWTAGLDGMTRDAHDNLFVAANGGQSVWRIGRNRSACALTSKLGLLPARGPSAVAFGTSTGPFAADSLFVVTFSGNILEIPHATDAPPALAGG